MYRDFLWKKDALIYNITPQATIMLRNLMNDMFYNRNLDDSRFQGNESVLLWFSDWEKDAQQNEELTAAERGRRFISRKTKFDLYSMVKGYRSYCKEMMQLFEGIQLVTHKTSQDYTELFFACQRAQQGQNTNPTEWQYGNCISKYFTLICTQSKNSLQYKQLPTLFKNAYENIHINAYENIA